MKKETDSREFDTQKLPDINLSIEQQILHGEGIPNHFTDKQTKEDHYKKLQFNEEPITVIINTNAASSKYPETCVAVKNNGKGAEVLIGNKWVEFTWLPLNKQIVVKRKYIEQLLLSKINTVNTIHDDANVEKPRNEISNDLSQRYPVSVIHDANPAGAAWLAQYSYAA